VEQSGNGAEDERDEARKITSNDLMAAPQPAQANKMAIGID
jgi:hypothetical protein